MTRSSIDGSTHRWKMESHPLGLKIMITIFEITEEFLKKNDGTLVWMRDDYLSMRGYAKGKPSEATLDKVARLKAEMREKGHIFKS